MARKTQLDRAIEKIDNDIAILQSARARLVDERMEAEAKKTLNRPQAQTEPAEV
jgi:hypothetical protein